MQYFIVFIRPYITRIVYIYITWYKIICRFLTYHGTCQRPLLNVIMNRPLESYLWVEYHYNYQRKAGVQCCIFTTEGFTMTIIAVERFFGIITSNAAAARFFSSFPFYLNHKVVFPGRWLQWKWKIRIHFCGFVRIDLLRIIPWVYTTLIVILYLICMFDVKRRL